MKIRHAFGVRSGVWFVSAAMALACSGNGVNLGGKSPLGGDGGPGGAGGSAGGGTGGAAGEGGVGAGGSGDSTSDAGTKIPSLPGVTHTSKLDLLLMVDNSISMADKQRVLKDTIPDLVNRITAAGSGVDDLHVGVITSSLGDHGAHSTCNGSDPSNPLAEQQDDHGEVIGARPRGQALGVPHVISWNRSGDAAAFTTQVQTAVSAVGEFGCGLEAQLEAVYRFLADPKPPADIQTAPCPGTTGTSAMCATPTGLDQGVLDQRAEFLRPDSAVGIVMLTDENDCSIRDTQQYFYAARQDIVLPGASSACAVNPNDACCYSCATTVPAGCTPDPACNVQGNPQTDMLNLRCFDEKQRFGIDFLYPVQRYVNAFTKTQLCTSRADLAPTAACPAADLVDNPLLVNGATVRDPSMVYLLGIVGVPWQDLASGTSTATTLKFKTPTEIASDGTWNVILGDSAASPPVLPTDGLMVESRAPRSGADVTGAPIPGPNATLAENNAMNGHDWANVANDDLMYACTFAVGPAQVRDCTVVQQQSPAPGCDCGSGSSPGDNNPLCQDPSTGAYGTIQYRAKAYPGLRELSVMKALGGQGIPASVCARNLTDDSRDDYGYRPAIDALLGSIGKSLR